MSSQILTHDAGKEHRPIASRWLAVLPDPEYCGVEKDLGAIMASWCRVLEQAGRTGYGPTKKAAIADVQRRFHTRPAPSGPAHKE